MFDPGLSPIRGKTKPDHHHSHMVYRSFRKLHLITGCHEVDSFAYIQQCTPQYNLNITGLDPGFFNEDGGGCYLGVVECMGHRNTSNATKRNYNEVPVHRVFLI